MAQKIFILSKKILMYQLFYNCAMINDDNDRSGRQLFDWIKVCPIRSLDAYRNLLL
jgi:hypothetical protein